MNRLKEFENNFGNNFISTRNFCAIHNKNEFENKNVYVISFNYTTYLKEEFDKFNDKNFLNIHGILEKPIFNIGFYGEYS